MGGILGFFRGAFLFVLCFCLSGWAGMAQATEGIILIASSDRLYRLERQGQNYAWRSIQEGEINDDGDYQRPRGMVRTPRGTTQVGSNREGRPTVRVVEPNRQLTLQMPKPPSPGDEYGEALRDGEGNFYIVLKDVGSFAFVRKDNQFSLRADAPQMQIAGNLTQMVANPYGEGLFAIAGDGETITLLLPPHRKEEDFRQVNWDAAEFLGGPAEKLVIGEVRGELVLVALGQSGKTGILRVNGQEIRELTLDVIASPEGAPQTRERRLVSSYESQALTRVQNAKLLLPRASAAPSTSRALVPVSNAPQATRPNVRPDPAFAHIKVDDADKPFLKAIRRHLTDVWTLDAFHNINTPLYDRSAQVERILDVLVRTTGNHPILLGEIGTGKTMVGDILARTLLSGQLSQAPRFQETFRNVVVVETTPVLMEGAGVAGFFQGVRSVEKKINKRILVVINRMWEMSSSQMTSLKATLARDPHFLVVGLSIPSHWGRLSQNDPEISRIFEPIELPELDERQTIELLKLSVVPGLQHHYRGTNGPARIDDEAILVAVQRARQLYPALGFPEGPRKLLEAMMVVAHRQAGEGIPVLDVTLARNYTKERLGLSFDVYNTAELEGTITRYRADLRNEIIEQDRIIDWLVDTYRDIIRPNATVRHKSVLLLGPTGSGKTYALKTAFAKFFGAGRVKEFDCTKYLEKESLTTLLGSWPGYVGSDKLGELPRFLDNEGKHLNGIIFNEWEKASPELANAIMTLLADGYITDSHGTRFYLGTSIIALTSNKGDEVFFPRGAALTRAEQERRALQATSEDVKKLFLEPDANNRYDMSKAHTPANMRRIDKAFYMLPPSPEGALRILRDLTLRDAKRAKGIDIQVDPRLMLALVTRLYHPENGTPDVQRTLISLIDGAYALHAQAIEGAPANSKPVLYLHWVPGEGTTAPEIRAGLSPDASQGLLIPADFARADVIPLEDPAVREHVRRLPEKLSKEVKGQKLAVEAAADAIATQRYFKPDPTRPSVLGFFGPTGTGKSELAEVIAEVEFGSRARCRSIQVGSIKDTADIDNIFGTARGRWGSETMAEFESFVARYEKEGGVIHFEEVGNVAPGNQAVRKTFFDILYSILLGKWTNAMGKVYDTSKFIIVFSSNEGQELFNDAPSDDLRMANYLHYRKVEYMRQVLLQAGWPQALIGRMQGNLILFAPLVRAVQKEIARKFIEKELTNLRRRYPITLDQEDEFYEQMGDLFFSHETGARGMLDFAEKQFEKGMRNVIQPIYDRFGREATDIIRRSKVRFRFTDNWRGLHYFVGPQPTPRKVMMYVELVDPVSGETFRDEMDITEAVTERKLPARRSLLKTAYHEAGHVVANDPRRTGIKMEHVTIVGQGSYGGYARWGQLAPTGPMRREEALAKLAMFLAGRTAEELAGFPQDGGWSADLEMARSLASTCVARYGLTDRALMLPVKEGKVDLGSPQVAAEISRLLQEAKAEAVRRLSEEWATVRLLTWRLFQEQFLDEAAINEVLRQGRSAEYRDSLRLPHQRTPIPANCAQALVAAQALALPVPTANGPTSAPQ